MATKQKSTGRNKRGTVKVNPSAPEQAAQQEQAQVKERTRKRKRVPLYAHAGADKPARGLVETPQDVTLEGILEGTYRLVERQFKTIAHWYAHCARVHTWRAERYAALAKDAHAHPEKYKRARGGATKEALAGKIGALEKALVAHLMAQGRTEEQALAEVAQMANG